MAATIQQISQVAQALKTVLPSLNGKTIDGEVLAGAIEASDDAKKITGEIDAAALREATNSVVARFHVGNDDVEKLLTDIAAELAKADNTKREAHLVAMSSIEKGKKVKTDFIPDTVTGGVAANEIVVNVDALNTAFKDTGIVFTAGTQKEAGTVFVEFTKDITENVTKTIQAKQGDKEIDLTVKIEKQAATAGNGDGDKWNWKDYTRWGIFGVSIIAALGGMAKWEESAGKGATALGIIGAVVTGFWGLACKQFGWFQPEQAPAPAPANKP